MFPYFENSQERILAKWWRPRTRESTSSPGSGGHVDHRKTAQNGGGSSETVPCAKTSGQLGHWNGDNDCPAKVKVVNWEETEEHVTEQTPPFPVTTFLSHRRERCASTSGVIDTACERTLAEKLGVELKRHATTMEVVPDNETFRFGPGAVKKSSRAFIFLVAVGQRVSPIESKTPWTRRSPCWSAWE